MQLESDPSTKPPLEELHWLPFEQCITYKLAVPVLTFKIGLTYVNASVSTYREVQQYTVAPFVVRPTTAQCTRRLEGRHSTNGLSAVLVLNHSSCIRPRQ